MARAKEPTEVAATLENPDKAAVEEKLRALFAALGG